MADELVSAARLAQIRAALDAVPAPPWHWVGDTHHGPILATVNDGWRAVMCFKRLGMQGAQPSFPDRRDGEKYAVLRTAKDMAIPRASYDPTSVRGIDNPVARWMQNSASYVADLLADRNALARKLADSHDANTDLQRRFDEFAEVCGEHSSDRVAEQVAAEDRIEALEAKLAKALGMIPGSGVEERFPNFASALKDVLA